MGATGEDPAHRPSGGAADDASDTRADGAPDGVTAGDGMTAGGPATVPDAARRDRAASADSAPVAALARVPDGAADLGSVSGRAGRGAGPVSGSEPGPGSGAGGADGAEPGGEPDGVPLSVDDVVRIAGFADRTPTREAMVIAYAYHRIALDLAEHLGRSAANWYCFAVWSSKAIGESLDLSRDGPFFTEIGARLRVPGLLRGRFRSVMLTLLGPTYQLALSLANRSIFLETGSFAASLVRPEGGGGALRVCPPAADEAAHGRGDGPVRRPEFLSELLSPADEEYLDISARLFRRAMACGDEAQRAELLLGANIALSAYEQARAQQALELVLYRPIRWLLRVSWRSVLATLTRRPFHRLRLYTTPHEDQPFLVRLLEGAWARLYTRYVMSLRTPVSEIRLGKPLVPPPGVDPEAVRAPIADAEVRRLAERFAAPTADGAVSGVANWLSYQERMRFIVSYFRMYLTVPDMFRPPFDPPAADELRAELERGEVPEPYAEWFERKVRAHEDRAGRPGLRGLIVRQFYRSPVRIDPDAAELARIDVTAYAAPRAGGA